MEPELTLEEVQEKLGQNPDPNAYSECLKNAHEVRAALSAAIEYNPDGVAEILGLEKTGILFGKQNYQDTSVPIIAQSVGIGRYNNLKYPINQKFNSMKASCERHR